MAQEVVHWDLQRVGKWLDDHSLSVYKSAFQAHNITGATLLELNYESLKDIGVVKVGDRARILQTIKREFRSRHSSVDVFSETHSNNSQRHSRQPSEPLSVSRSRADSLSRSDSRNARPVGDIPPPLHPPPTGALPPVPQGPASVPQGPASAPSMASTPFPSTFGFSFGDGMLTNIIGTAFAPPKTTQLRPLVVTQESPAKTPRVTIDADDDVMSPGRTEPRSATSPAGTRRSHKFFEGPSTAGVNTKTVVATVLANAPVGPTPVAPPRRGREPVSSLHIAPRSSSIRPGDSGGGSASPSSRQESPTSPISQLITLGFIEEGRRRDDHPPESLFVRSRSIRVKGTRDQTFVIDVGDLGSAARVREAIFERFGILDRSGYVLLAIDSAKSEVLLFFNF